MGRRRKRRGRQSLHLRIFPSEFPGQPRTRSSGSCLVSSRGRNPQLNLRARIALAPHREFDAQKFSAFAHATQTVMSGASVFIQKLRVNSFSVIADPQAKLPSELPESPFDQPVLSALEGATHG